MEFLKDLAASLRSARTVELPKGEWFMCLTAQPLGTAELDEPKT